MNFDDFLKVVFIVLTVVSYVGYRWTSAMPVYLKYRDQKVGVRTKWWRR